MSIFLYDGNDKVVSGIGKCNIEDLIIDSRCYWKKNDYFYIELDIIKDDEKKYKRIKELDIIKCKTPFSNNSLFRIKEIEKECSLEEFYLKTTGQNLPEEEIERQEKNRLISDKVEKEYSERKKNKKKNLEVTN